MPHKRTNRIVFYLNDEEEGRLDKAVAESGLIRADYLREVVDSVWSVAFASTEGNTNGSTGGALREAQAQIHGLEELITQMRERQGMSDSQNQELNQRLQEALSTSDRLTLMLPSPSSNGHRPWWRVW